MTWQMHVGGVSISHHERSSRGEVMHAAVAREIAIAAHHQSRDRHGGLVIEHVARVAAAVPPEAKPTAWLHDVLEKTPTTLDDLREQGLGAFEGEALALLTRADGESYELHVLRIAHARRPAGRLARTIKLADLDDHAESHEWALGDPPYRWAQHHVNDGIARIDTEPWPVVVLSVPAASG